MSDVVLLGDSLFDTAYPEYEERIFTGGPDRPHSSDAWSPTARYSVFKLMSDWRQRNIQVHPGTSQGHLRDTPQRQTAYIAVGRCFLLASPRGFEPRLPP